MNRRGFVGALLGGAAGLALDPERLLWRPGKLISIPKTLHVPAVRVIGCDFFVDAGECPLTFQELRACYIEPAVYAIRSKIKREAEGRPVQFQRLYGSHIVEGVRASMPNEVYRISRGYLADDAQYCLSVGCRVKI